ncbi:hypothetical protein BCR34DRAFT_597592 [Clohesyomyces aquaticus]|uniref:Uncharacterized protein n=1 Tax=Clohesyomyces aquaticus TaxID=1231657 RepID=A0A1Y2A230_9PLEO|nr:hypothetical protein BCR34DRAFT_597592 [Clohesyomyces aquaticus]
MPRPLEGVYKNPQKSHAQEPKSSIPTRPESGGPTTKSSGVGSFHLRKPPPPSSSGSRSYALSPSTHAQKMSVSKIPTLVPAAESSQLDISSARRQLPSPLHVSSPQPLQTSTVRRQEGIDAASPPDFSSPQRLRVNTAGRYQGSSAPIPLNFSSPQRLPVITAGRNQLQPPSLLNIPTAQRFQVTRYQGRNTPSPLAHAVAASPAQASPASLDKPLPSIPVGHVVDPSSPPKVSRTLIDATVAGTPTEEEWPTLQPENINIATTSFSSAVNPVPRNFSVPQHHMESTRTRSRNQDTESPLAHKRSFREKSDAADLVKPPQLLSPVLRNTVAGTRSRPHKSGSTKWPLLNMEPLSNDNLPRSSEQDEQGWEKDASFPDSLYNTPKAQEKGLTPQSPNVTPCSLSTSEAISPYTGSPYAQKISEQDADLGSRVKRLSNHSIKSGLGPVLTISDDADSLLLGNLSQVPDIPPMPEGQSQSVLEERPASSLSTKIMRERIPSALSNTFRRSRPSTARSDSTMDGGSTSAKIVPIRSMQPPRKASVESGPKNPFVNAIQNPVVAATVDQKGPEEPGIQKKPVVRRDGPVGTYILSTGSSRRRASLAKIPTRGSSMRSASNPIKQATRVASDASTHSEPVKEARSADETLSGEATLQSDKKSDSGSRSAPVTSAGIISKVGPAFSNALQPRQAGIPRPLGRQPPPVVPPTKRNPVSRFAGDNPFHIDIPTSAQGAPCFGYTSTTVEGGPAALRTGVKGDAIPKIRLKKSFRNLFQKKDHKQTKLLPAPKEPKRRSLTAPGNRFAQHFRSSVTSKGRESEETTYNDPVHKEFASPEPDANVTTRPEPADKKSTHLGRTVKEPAEFGTANKQPAGKEAVRQEPDQQLKSTSDAAKVATPTRNTQAMFPSSPNLTISTNADISAIVSPTRALADAVVQDIMDTVNDLPVDSPERVRAIQISQAVVQTAEMVLKTRIAAHKAKRYAREAELCSNTAEITLKRVQDLVRSNLDTAESIMDLISRFPVPNTDATGTIKGTSST